MGVTSLSNPQTLREKMQTMNSRIVMAFLLAASAAGGRIRDARAVLADAGPTSEHFYDTACGDAAH
jgi:hypothetical protein